MTNYPLLSGLLGLGFAVAGCAGAAAVDGELPADVQFLALQDADGHRYELPYRAALTPDEAAQVLTIAAIDDAGKSIALTPVVAKGKVPEVDMDAVVAGFEIWPPRPAGGEKGYFDYITSYYTCWADQDIFLIGDIVTYTVHDSYSVDGFIDPGNEFVDFDLYLYSTGTLLSSSLGLAGYVDSCGGYLSQAINQSWDFLVKRYNAEFGTYRFCTYFDSAF